MIPAKLSRAIVPQTDEKLEKPGGVTLGGSGDRTGIWGQSSFSGVDLVTGGGGDDSWVRFTALFSQKVE